MSSTINFTAIGNYRVISYDRPFKNVTSIRGYVSDTENEIPDYSFLYYEYRWSINGENWSLWAEMITDSLELTVLNPDNPLYLELRVTAKSNEDVSPHLNIGQSINPPIILNDIEPDLTFRYTDPRNLATKPSVKLSDEKYDKPIIFNPSCNSTFNPYAVNNGIHIQQDLSYTVNVLFGHEVNYYSVQPNGRGKDVVLREYNLFDVVDEKCIKVLVDKNNFGDGKPIYDSFGVNFEAPIEINIDRKYFESVFGKGSQPRRRDIIYFPLTNRIYSIETTYLHRDFNYYPIYFKCQLVKYEKRQDTSWDNPIAEKSLHDYTVNAKDLFGPETEDQIEKITKPQQYYTSTQKRKDDPVRSYIAVNTPIIEYNLNNNWTVVFNSYYDLETLSYEGVKEAVRYNSSPILEEDGELGFSCWFRLRNFIDTTKLVPKPPKKLPISSYTQGTGTITYSTFPVKHMLSPVGSPSIDGYISLLGGNRTGGYQLIDVPDEYTFTVSDDGSPITSILGWRAQKAELRTLIDGHRNNKGLRIDIIWTGTNSTDRSTNDYIETGSFRISLNDKQIFSPFGAGINNSTSNFIPFTDSWYGFVFNISNIYGQYSINSWGLTYDPDNPAMQSSDLALLHNDNGFLDQKYTFSFTPDIEQDHDNPTWSTDKNSYKLPTSPLYITNLRMFKHMIAQEKQSTILNQNIIGDSQLALIIDNAKPVLKLPSFVRNR